MDTSVIPFTYKKLRYEIVDAPGHVEFTKNMVTGASQADIAIVVIDASIGLEEQTRRHTYLLRFLGIEKIICAINKIDLIDYEQSKYEDVKNDFAEYCTGLGLKVTDFVPTSTLTGEGIEKLGAKLSWYKGKALLPALATLAKEKTEHTDETLRMSIQDRYNFHQPSIAVGTLASGQLSNKQKVKVLPANKTIEIDKVFKYKDNIDHAQAGDSVGILSAEELQRGDVLVSGETEDCTSTIHGNFFWMGIEPLQKKQEVLLRIETQEVKASVKEIHDRIDTSTLELHKEGYTDLHEHEAAVVTFVTEKPIYATSTKADINFSRFVVEKENKVQGAGVIV